jgi:polyisoprenyl-phosphate glycosyltransferase
MTLTTSLISVGLILDRPQTALLPRLTQIGEYLRRQGAAFELLIVDNGTAAAATAQIADQLRCIPHVRLLRLSRRYPLDTAVAALVDQAIGDYVVLMELDQDPQLIGHLLNAAFAGHDIVVTRRNLAAHYGWFDRTIGALLYRLAGRLLGVAINPQDGFSRVFSRRAVNALTRVRSRRRHLRLLGPAIGFRQTAIELATAPPRAGRFSRLGKLLALLDLVVSTSVAPLRLAAFVGVLASLLSAAYLAYIVAVTIVRGGQLAEGWLTSSLTTTTLFFLLFVMLSILAEYIGRLLEEVKDEPLYFIESEEQSPVTVFTRLLDDEELNVVQS